jgi:hypothetical protein
MLQPTFRNVILFVLVKYILFAIILAFIDNRFYTIVTLNSKNSREFINYTIYYAGEILIVIIFFELLFSLPIYFAFKIKRGEYFVFVIVIIFILDYFAYSYLNSLNLNDSLYNLFSSILFSLLFFYRAILNKFRKKAKGVK